MSDEVKIKSSIAVLWWAVGMGGSVALWFLPLPQGRIPTILFICTSVIYALLSPAIYKVKEIEGRAD